MRMYFLVKLALSRMDFVTSRSHILSFLYFKKICKDECAMNYYSGLRNNQQTQRTAGGGTNDTRSCPVQVYSTLYKFILSTNRGCHYLLLHCSCKYTPSHLLSIQFVSLLSCLPYYFLVYGFPLASLHFHSKPSYRFYFNILLSPPFNSLAKSHLVIS